MNRTNQFESVIGRTFHEYLTDRLNSRRNIPVVSLVMYLCNRDALSKNSLASYPLKLQSKNVVHNTGTQMIKRLFTESEETENLSETENSEEIVTGQMSFSEEMNKEIETTWGKLASSSNSSYSDSGTVQGKTHKDLRFYDKHGKRSPLLDQLFLALCSIQSTSTQSERNFSLAGSFVTKIRTRLSSSHLNMFCFLKSHFLSK